MTSFFCEVVFFVFFDIIVNIKSFWSCKEGISIILLNNVVFSVYVVFFFIFLLVL